MLTFLHLSSATLRCSVCGKQAQFTLFLVWKCVFVCWPFLTSANTKFDCSSAQLWPVPGVTQNKQPPQPKSSSRTTFDTRWIKCRVAPDARAAGCCLRFLAPRVAESFPSQKRNPSLLDESGRKKNNVRCLLMIFMVMLAYASSKVAGWSIIFWSLLISSVWKRVRRKLNSHFHPSY